MNNFNDKELKDFNEIARLSSLCVDECLIVIQKVKLAVTKSDKGNDNGNDDENDDETTSINSTTTIINSITDSYEVIANLSIGKLINSVTNILSLLDNCNSANNFCS